MRNDWHHWLTNAGKWAAQSGGRATRIALILVLATVASRLAGRVTHRVISSLGSRAALQARYRRAPGRANAVASSLAGVIRVIIWVIAIPMILAEVGLNLGPLIAGATIVGAALGFGAQTLVKDLLSGFLILTEDQYASGDTIVISGQSGVVEDVNLLRTRIRGDDGKVWFVANGEIRTVANASLEWAQANVDVLIPLSADLDAALAAAQKEALAFAAEPKWAELVLDPPQAFAQAVIPEGVTLRVSARTVAGRSFLVTRALLPRVIRSVRAVVPEANPLPPAAGASAAGPPGAEPSPGPETPAGAGPPASGPPASGPADSGPADAGGPAIPRPAGPLPEAAQAGHSGPAPDRRPQPGGPGVNS